MSLLIRIFVVIILAEGFGYACDCIESQMDVSYSRATHVFYGEVADAGTFGKTPKGATFKVSHWFKGPKKDLIISVAPVKTDCDLIFQVGDKWLIFGTGVPPRTTQCNASQLLERSIQKK